LTKKYVEIALLFGDTGAKDQDLPSAEGQRRDEDAAYVMGLAVSGRIDEEDMPRSVAEANDMASDANPAWTARGADWITWSAAIVDRWGPSAPCHIRTYGRLMDLPNYSPRYPDRAAAAFNGYLLTDKDVATFDAEVKRRA
jgi:hypothetical protein